MTFVDILSCFEVSTQNVVQSSQELVNIQPDYGDDALTASDRLLGTSTSNVIMLVGIARCRAAEEAADAEI